jgi:cell division transport system permease protein
MNALRYAVAEAIVSLRRAGQSAVMSLGTITVAFVTLGGFLLLAGNLQTIGDRWASAAEMSVYLRDEADAAARRALLAELSAHQAVAAVEYVSSAEARERFTADFPELGDVAAPDANPFPPSLEVRLRTDAGSPEAAARLAEQLAAHGAVADVQYDRAWLSRLLGMVQAVRVAGVMMAGVLVIGAAFTVAAIVRLSLVRRMHELDIMLLVGAPAAYVRGPFIAEGAMLGGIGATIALAVLGGIFIAVRSGVTSALAGYASPGDLRFLGMADASLLILAGFAMGSLAGLTASRGIRSLNDR